MTNGKPLAIEPTPSSRLPALIQLAQAYSHAAALCLLETFKAEAFDPSLSPARRAGARGVLALTVGGRRFLAQRDTLPEGERSDGSTVAPHGTPEPSKTGVGVGVPPRSRPKSLAMPRADTRRPRKPRRQPV